jgi:hypothetical protein
MRSEWRTCAVNVLKPEKKNCIFKLNKCAFKVTFETWIVFLGENLDSFLIITWCSSVNFMWPYQYFLQKLQPKTDLNFC